MRQKIVRYSIIGFCILILGLAVFRIASRIIENSTKIPPLSFSVGSIILKNRPMTESVSGEGIVEGDPQVLVYPQVGGKFQYNTVLEGSYVQYNQPLAYIDRDIVGQTYNLAPVRSPIEGIVIKLYYMDRGTLVTTANAIAEVADPKKIKVEVSLGVDDLMKVKQGMPAAIYYENNSNINMNATVFTVTPFVESETLSGTVTVTSPLTNSRLMIGMTVLVDIIIDVTNTLIVPEESVIANLDKIYIFVNDHGKAKQVNVSRSYSYNGWVEVKGDIKEGDEVITEGAFKLNDGDSIKTFPTPVAER
jgi:multidrug efflux pump subunit AcrA (membrane-fusion protein)